MAENQLKLAIENGWFIQSISFVDTNLYYFRICAPNNIISLIISNSVRISEVMVGLMDRFKKEDSDYGEEMVEERPRSTYEPESEVEETKLINESKLEAKIDNQSSETSSMTDSSSSDIGIDALMNKRMKLEEAIDYVGLMIKNLKEKRTKLEKEIEEESVDIKNLKEKLVKVREYINEENRGISDLTNKRSKVEGEADEVSSIITDLKDKLLGIDKVVNAENAKINSFKESRQKVE